jgi:hypothetical protein
MILIVKTREVAIQIFFKVCPTNKKNGCQKKGNTQDWWRIVNKKTIQGLTKEFDCDATLELAELEVNKIKVKCAFVKQLQNILQLMYQQEILFPLQLKSKNVKHLLL